MGLFLFNSWVHLVGKVDGWGNTMYTLREFFFWVRTACNDKLCVYFWCVCIMALCVYYGTVCHNYHGQWVWTAPDTLVMSLWCSLQPPNSTTAFLPWKASRMDRNHSHKLSWWAFWRDGHWQWRRHLCLCINVHWEGVRCGQEAAGIE